MAPYLFRIMLPLSILLFMYVLLWNLYGFSALPGLGLGYTKLRYAESGSLKLLISTHPPLTIIDQCTYSSTMAYLRPVICLANATYAHNEIRSGPSSGVLWLLRRSSSRACASHQLCCLYALTVLGYCLLWTLVCKPLDSLLYY